MSSTADGANEKRRHGVSYEFGGFVLNFPNENVAVVVRGLSSMMTRVFLTLLS